MSAVVPTGGGGYRYEELPMKLLLGSDHAGFELKEACKEHLCSRDDVNLTDMGVFNLDSADYPLIAHDMARAIASGSHDGGILICGTGLGMSIVANRHKGVRAALCHNLFTARMARLHNDANILVMGGRVIGTGLALGMVDVFLETAFEGGRHRTRLDMID